MTFLSVLIVCSLFLCLLQWSVTITGSPFYSAMVPFGLLVETFFVEPSLIWTKRLDYLRTWLLLQWHYTYYKAVWSKHNCQSNFPAFWGRKRQDFLVPVVYLKRNMVWHGFIQWTVLLWENVLNLSWLKNLWSTIRFIRVDQQRRIPSVSAIL